MMEVRLGPLLRDYLHPPNLPFRSQSNLMITWPSKVSTTVCQRLLKDSVTKNGIQRPLWNSVSRFGITFVHVEENLDSLA